MIDLETMGTRPNCQVLTIGGVKFDHRNNTEPYGEFYYKFTMEDQEAKGRTVDDDTLDWWSKQEPEVLLEAFGDDGRTDTHQVLKELNRWLVGVDIIWAHGSTFDIVILENMYEMYGLPVPWPFWKVKDSRTLLSIADKDPRKSYDFEAHNALADAYVQAKCVQDVVRDYNLTLRA